MKRSISHKLAAAVTAGAIAGSSFDALANQNFADMSKNLVDSSAGFQNLISTVCWLGGAGLGVAGVFKLKQHVDNPGQVAMKDGLVRLGAGGGLLMFPFIQEAMVSSIAADDKGGVDITDLQLDSTSQLEFD